MSTPREQWARRRADAFALGAKLRERLVGEYMAEYRLSGRPLLKDVAESLITDVQDARLIHGALPIDTFAQTERIGDRLEVTINSRGGEMAHVKEPGLLELVALFHESIHIDVDFSEEPRDDPETPQLALPGIVASPRLIMCRRGRGERGIVSEREFRAENGGLAAAIAGPDLALCESFLRFQSNAEQGGELGGRGWRLLYETTEFIGVNISALVRYLTHRGLIQADGNRLYGSTPLFGRLEWP